MKKIYTLLLFFVTFFSNAQVDKLGGTPAKGVTLLTNADISPSTTVVNKTPIQQPQQLTPGLPTGTSSEVGVTGGQLSVSLTGAANYTIPFAVPPGNKGVVPQISTV